MLADNIDFVTKAVLKQVGGTCAAHGFFVTLSEIIQQKYKKDVEFDLYKYFDEMEAWRLEQSPKPRRVTTFMETASNQGYKTTTGETVKIERWYQLKPSLYEDVIKNNMQRYGPLIFGVHTFKGHDLKPRGDVVGAVPEGAVKKKTGHVMLLRGFDGINKLWKFQNSWGDGSIKYMPFEVFNDICKYVYVIASLTMK